VPPPPPLVLWWEWCSYLVLTVVLAASLQNETNAIWRAICAGEYPGIMQLSWGVVDVRDVARVSGDLDEIPL
jgi:hypothetical protein